VTPEHIDTTEPTPEHETVRADQLQPFRHWLTGTPPVEVLAVLSTSPTGDQFRVTVRDSDGYLSDLHMTADASVELATKDEIAAARDAADRRDALDGIEEWVAWMRDHPEIPAPYPAMSVGVDVETVRALAAQLGWPLQKTDIRVRASHMFGAFTFGLDAYLSRDGA
jgi:hypothetical protein